MMYTVYRGGLVTNCLVFKPGCISTGEIYKAIPEDYAAGYIQGVLVGDPSWKQRIWGELYRYHAISNCWYYWHDYPK